MYETDVACAFHRQQQQLAAQGLSEIWTVVCIAASVRVTGWSWTAIMLRGYLFIGSAEYLTKQFLQRCPTGTEYKYSVVPTPQKQTGANYSLTHSAHRVKKVLCAALSYVR